MTALFPHCDDQILHAPDKCSICAMFPKLQQERIKNGINFTGESDPDKLPCPATERRSLRDINKWSGNRPEPPKRIVIYKGSQDTQ